MRMKYMFFAVCKLAIYLVYVVSNVCCPQSLDTPVFVMQLFIRVLNQSLDVYIIYRNRNIDRLFSCLSV